MQHVVQTRAFVNLPHTDHDSEADDIPMKPLNSILSKLQGNFHARHM